ncbi:MAG: hypothetical protein Q9162_003574 [Coniocarpon cinnabarinum]
MAETPARYTQGQPHDRIGTLGPAAKEKPSSMENDVTFVQKMLSAISGSVLTSLVVTPLDVVRVRLQSQQSANYSPPPTPSPKDIRNTPPVSSVRTFSNLPPNLGVTACCREVFWVNNNASFCMVAPSVSLSQTPATAYAADCAAEEAQRKSFNSTFDGLRKIARNEGLTTLWRGLSPTLAMAVPGNVIYFAGYDWLRTSSLSPMGGRVPEAYSPLVAGSSARVLAALVVSPIELFRTRMQAAESQSAAENFKKTLSGVRDMVRAQGYHTLWRGLTMTLWRDVPFSALYWWGYEAGRNLITDNRERARGKSVNTNAPMARRRAGSRSQQGHSSTFVDSFIAGAASGGIASVVTTPFDVGKTRQQVFRHSGDTAQTSGRSAGSLTAEENSMMRMLLHIYKEEGVRGLFKGWAPRCLKVAPACAIMISSYEMGKKFAAGVGGRDA